MILQPLKIPLSEPQPGVRRVQRRSLHDVLNEFECGIRLAAGTWGTRGRVVNLIWIAIHESLSCKGHDVPSPVFFHFPVIQYMPCLSITTELDGPAMTWEAIEASFGPAN